MNEFMEGSIYSDNPFEAAAAWRVRRADGRMTAADEAAFLRWLDEDAVHAMTYAQVQREWALVAAVGSEPELLAMRREALDRAEKAARKQSSAPKTRVWMPVAAAIAAVVFISYFGVFRNLVQAQRLVTEAGERRIVTLQDGTRISLDERTHVTVRFSRGARQVSLDDGQAEFQVAKDQSRPFSVQFRRYTVVATGTVFSVDVGMSSAAVTLVEGHVVVTGDQAQRSGTAKAIPLTVDLDPGEQLTIGPREEVSVRSGVDPDKANAWKSGKLIFDRQPLQLAIERVNRYSGPQITTAGPITRGVIISGVFDAGDAAAFAEAVTAQLNIVRSVSPTGDIILELNNQVRKPSATQNLESVNGGS